MYDAIKVTFNRVLFSYEMQTFDFVVFKDRNLFGDLNTSARKLLSSNKNLLKELNKNLNTDRSYKKRKQLSALHQQNLYQFLVEVNMAHQHLQYFCSILYLAENDLKYLEDMTNIAMGELENNFISLVKSLDALDGTDRETLILFNKLRNLLCHTSIQQAKIYLGGEILVDVIDISLYIEEFLKLIIGYNKEKFEKLIALNVERYGSDSMIESLKENRLL